MTMYLENGDLFAEHHNFDAIAHGVNVHGVMGAGIAKIFREKYPEMYERYRIMCMYKILTPGSAYVYEADDKEVWNLASQDLPGANASDKWYAQALVDAVEKSDLSVHSKIGLPMIGAGIGGLSPHASLNVVKNVAVLYPGLDFVVVALSPLTADVRA